jgi:hypothetical protein
MCENSFVIPPRQTDINHTAIASVRQEGLHNPSQSLTSVSDVWSEIQKKTVCSPTGQLMSRGEIGGNVKNFFVAGLSSEQVARLQAAQVSSHDFSINGVAGLVIDESCMPQVLETLGLQIHSEQLTPFEGILRVTLREVSPTTPDGRERLIRIPEVTVARWDNIALSQNTPDLFVKSVREIMLPILGMDVQLSFVNRKPRGTVPCGPSGTISIHLGEGLNIQRDTPRRILGYNLGGYTRLPPEGDGLVLEDEEGFPYAQIIGEEIFILMNIGHHGNAHEDGLFRLILEKLLPHLENKNETSEEREERLRQVAERLRTESRAAYIKACSARLNKTIAATREKISKGEVDIRSSQEQLVRMIREIQGATRKLEQLLASESQHRDAERYGAEFDQMFRIANVKDVRISNRVISVYTDTLYCVDPRTNMRHEIGRFRIEIYIDGNDNGIRWFNLDRKVNGFEGGMQAPHVYSSGKACLGNITETVCELIASYEFAALTMVAIQFIESVNTDDAAGKYIDRWPIATGR